MKYSIWHNTRGTADEYFVTQKHGNHVYFKIPKWIGRLLVRLREISLK